MHTLNSTMYVSRNHIYPEISTVSELKCNTAVLTVRRLVNRVKMKDERKNRIEKDKMPLHGQLIYMLKY